MYVGILKPPNGEIFVLIFNSFSEVFFGGGKTDKFSGECFELENHLKKLSDQIWCGIL